MVSLMVFAFGLAIGSFLNAFLYRLEVQQGLRYIPNCLEKIDITVLRGRSFCPHCGHTLAWYDLIPLLSFLSLMGKCRYCKDKISFQYPLVELAAGFIFVALFLTVFPWSRQVFSTLVSPSFPQVAELLYLWAVASLMIVIFVYDLKHYLIPDKILYLAILVSGIWYLVSSIFFYSYTKYEILNTIYSALGAAAFFLAIYLVSKGRWMGFGDVKLAFLLGLFLGWPSILVALFSAFCLGALVGLVLIVFKKRGLKSEVPFAPFLVAGTAIAFFFGSDILSWYLGLFLV